MKCKFTLFCFAMLLLPLVLKAQNIVVWHGYSGKEDEAFEKVVANYNASQADDKPKVFAITIPYDALATKISAAIPRGKGPDIVIYAQDRLGAWVAAGNTVQPIDLLVENSTKGRFLKATLDAMTYQGNLYGLPLNYKVITMIYNKNLISAPPKTTTELVATARKLTDTKAGKFGLAYSYADFYYHAALMNGFGGGVFGTGRTPTINSAGNVNSLELLLEWMNQGIMPDKPSAPYVTSLFNESKAAIVFSGPWFLSEISEKIDYGLAPLPTIDEAGGKPMRPWITVEGLYIAAGSKNKEAAYEFIKYATDVTAVKIMAIEGRQTPANKAIYADPAIANDPVLRAFRQQIDVAIPMPNVPEMMMVLPPVTTAMNSITQKTATPKQALDVAQKEVEQEIAKLPGRE